VRPQLALDAHLHHSAAPLGGPDRVSERGAWQDRREALEQGRAVHQGGDADGVGAGGEGRETSELDEAKVTPLRVIAHQPESTHANHEALLLYGSKNGSTALVPDRLSQRTLKPGSGFNSVETGPVCDTDGTKPR
jgi:hypothetical protein